jgi:mono/diheme cytochrome c family protein
MKENMSVMNKGHFLTSMVLAAVVAIASGSCGQKTTQSTGWEFSRNMYDPIGYNPDQPNNNFKNGQTAQTPPAGTVPVDFATFPYENTPEDYERSSQEVNPLVINAQLLEEGAALYQVYCAVCHGPEGKGDGSITKDRELVTKNGSRKLENFPPPPAYGQSGGASSSRGGLMSELTDGKIYHTITYGVGLMGSHASQLSPDERWKVVAYVKELQKK